MRDRPSHVLEQGRIRIVLTGALVPDHEIGAHVARHGDGVKVIALSVSRTSSTRTARRSRAAPAASWSRTSSQTTHGVVRLASIATYGDTLHTFVDRSDYKGAYLPGYIARGGRHR